MWTDTQTPGALESQVAEELRPNAALYRQAAILVSSLAAVAPPSVKSFATSENARARFHAMATGFGDSALDNTDGLGNLDTSGLDAGTTGCAFNLGKPDGIVATQFTSN